VPDRPYTAEEVDAAVDRLQQPGRLAHAEQVVTHAAPGLQRVLNAALDEGGWFGEAHDTEVAKAALEPDDGERLTRLRTLIADETRIGMLVGVAVGFELAHELQAQRESTEET